MTEEILDYLPVGVISSIISKQVDSVEIYFNNLLLAGRTIEIIPVEGAIWFVENYEDVVFTTDYKGEIIDETIIPRKRKILEFNYDNFRDKTKHEAVFAKLREKMLKFEEEIKKEIAEIEAELLIA